MFKQNSREMGFPIVVSMGSFYKATSFAKWQIQSNLYIAETYGSVKIVGYMQVSDM